MNYLPFFPARVLRAVVLGVPGIALLPFLLSVPEGVPAIALVVNPLILLIVAAIAGAWAAPRAGFGSAVVLGTPIRLRHLGLWLAAGLVTGLAVAMIDHATAPFWQVEGVHTLREGRDAASLALGLLYGGLTEELLLRFGFMSLLAVGLLRLLPRQASLWIAAVLAALAFALAHLPAVVLEAGALPPALLARTLIWNGLLGFAFGAAFLRHGLEAAILAHMGAHLGFAIAAF